MAKHLNMLTRAKCVYDVCFVNKQTAPCVNQPEITFIYKPIFNQLELIHFVDKTPNGWNGIADALYIYNYSAPFTIRNFHFPKHISEIS